MMRCVLHTLQGVPPGTIAIELSNMGKKTNSETKAVSAAKPAAPSSKAKRVPSEPTKPKKKSPLAKAATVAAAVAVAAGSAIAKTRAAVKKTAASKTAVPKKPSAKKTTRAANKLAYTQEDVALRAYFISERRRAEGLHNNPEQNWLDAERELQAEFAVRS
jgi:hypothetical protein